MGFVNYLPFAAMAMVFFNLVRFTWMDRDDRWLSEVRETTAEIERLSAKLEAGEVDVDPRTPGDRWLPGHRCQDEACKVCGVASSFVLPLGEKPRPLHPDSGRVGRGA